MARKWSELQARLSPERRRRNEEAARALLAAMDLDELRQGRGVTQEELAERLGIRQSGVSRLERRPDMLVSSLRAVIEALGGELELVARFADGAVRLRRFESNGRAG